ncbi:MAG: hypothetical protein ACPGUD_04790 [Parashewanella sp.]
MLEKTSLPSCFVGKVSLRSQLYDVYLITEQQEGAVLGEEGEKFLHWHEPVSAEPVITERSNHYVLGNPSREHLFFLREAPIAGEIESLTKRGRGSPWSVNMLCHLPDMSAAVHSEQINTQNIVILKSKIDLITTKLQTLREESEMQFSELASDELEADERVLPNEAEYLLELGLLQLTLSNCYLNSALHVYPHILSISSEKSDETSTSISTQPMGENSHLHSEEEYKECLEILRESSRNIELSNYNLIASMTIAAIPNRHKILVKQCEVYKLLVELYCKHVTASAYNISSKEVYEKNITNGVHCLERMIELLVQVSPAQKEATILFIANKFIFLIETYYKRSLIHGPTYLDKQKAINLLDRVIRSSEDLDMPQVAKLVQATCVKIARAAYEESKEAVVLEFATGYQMCAFEYLDLALACCAKFASSDIEGEIMSVYFAMIQDLKLQNPGLLGPENYRFKLDKTLELISLIESKLSRLSRTQQIEVRSLIIEIQIEQLSNLFVYLEMSRNVDKVKFVNQSISRIDTKLDELMQWKCQEPTEKSELTILVIKVVALHKATAKAYMKLSMVRKSQASELKTRSYECLSQLCDFIRDRKIEKEWISAITAEYIEAVDYWTFLISQQECSDDDKRRFEGLKQESLDKLTEFRDKQQGACRVKVDEEISKWKNKGFEASLTITEQKEWGAYDWWVTEPDKMPGKSIEDIEIFAMQNAREQKDIGTLKRFKNRLSRIMIKNK